MSPVVGAVTVVVELCACVVNDAVASAITATPITAILNFMDFPLVGSRDGIARQHARHTRDIGG
jgi:hypothetical protein